MTVVVLRIRLILDKIYIDGRQQMLERKMRETCYEIVFRSAKAVR